MKNLITIMIMLVAVGCGDAAVDLGGDADGVSIPKANTAIQAGLAARDNPFWDIILFGGIFLGLLTFGLNVWVYKRKKLKDTISQKSKLPKIKFKDSGWVLVYVICGWISCVCSLIIVLIGAFGGSFKSSVIAALPILFAGLGSLLAAHILRLLEKGVHHLKSIDENKNPPN